MMHHTNNHNARLLAITAAFAALCFVGLTGAHAATLTWSGGNNNWDNDASWGGSEPVSGDQAVVNNGNTVTVNLGGEIAGALNLSGGSTVNVENSGVLTLDAVSQSFSLNVNNGNLNVTGGSATASGVVNNFINNSGIVTVSAGSFSHTATNLRFGDGASTGTLSVNGSGSWSGGNLNIIGTANMNLSGSTAQITGVNINNGLGGTMNVNLTPGSGGINAIATSGLNLSSTDTLSVDVSSFGGQQALTLISYSGALTSIFDTVNITNSAIGAFTLGADPLGDPTNLGFGEYFLDYGGGSNDNVTLFYNTIPAPAALPMALIGLMGLAARRRGVA